MKRQRGFAMIYALMVLGLVALAVYALAAHFAFQATRTRVTETDAQLHQYLLAGNNYVVAEAANWPGKIEFKSTTLVLPSDPAQQDAKVALTLLNADAGNAKVEIAASANKRNVVEQLSLKFDNGHWHVTGAELIGEGQ
jgi:type II secretory pathway pseudopilin PulG